MITIYVDNFRGFEKTFLPLKKVNFMVGENSTGKTSFLSLFSVISNYLFWFGNFSLGNSNLGFFKEISTKHCTKKNFKIGVFKNEFKKDKDKFVGALFDFTEGEDGTPQVRAFSYVDNHFKISSKISKNKIQYIFAKSEKKMTDVKDERIKYFKKWVEDNSKPIDKSKAKEAELRNAPIIFELKKIISEKSNYSLDVDSFLDLHNEVNSLAPIRAEPRRTYDNYQTDRSSQGQHIPYLLNRILSDKKEIKYKNKLIKILSKFGKESGLFEKINTKPLGEKGEKTAPFELHVYYNNTPFKISNVGYGIAQALPVIVEIATRKNSTYAIQQPEIHLHPKAQAALGEFFYDMSCKELNHNLIIETHSDYIIDRFRYCLSQSKKKFNDAQVIFFEKTNKGNKLTCIEVLSDGNYSKDQPSTFKDFFIDEGLKKLQI